MLLKKVYKDPLHVFVSISKENFYIILFPACSLGFEDPHCSYVLILTLENESDGVLKLTYTQIPSRHWCSHQFHHSFQAENPHEARSTLGLIIFWLTSIRRRLALELRVRAILGCTITSQWSRRSLYNGVCYVVLFLLEALY